MGALLPLSPHHRMISLGVPRIWQRTSPHLLLGELHVTGGMSFCPALCYVDFFGTGDSLSLTPYQPPYFS